MINGCSEKKKYQLEIFSLKYKSELSIPQCLI
jgi:hypothetical protein